MKYLFEDKLDDIIADNNPVRFIDACVDKLDLIKPGQKWDKDYLTFSHV
jgi:hypothetical protein